jgi:hypothetical protein
MGYIKEPKGIDFTIQSEPLNDKARADISEFIRTYKLKKAVQKTAGKKLEKKKKLQSV